MIRELEMEEKEIPRRKAQETARLAGVNASLEIAKNQLEVMRKRIKDEEAEAQEIRERVKDLKIAQTSISSNKEMQQSIIQIESLEHDIESCENRALALQEDEIPGLEARVVEAEEKVAAERGGVDGYVEDLDGRLNDVKARLAELRIERVEKADAVKAVDPRIGPAFLLYYERLSTKRWPVVTQLSSDDVCDGCHMKQPPFVAQLVRHNSAAAANGGKQQQAACTMCGRLLYGDL